MRWFFLALGLSFGLVACQAQESPALTKWQHSSGGTIAASLSAGGQYALVVSYNQPAGWWNLAENKRLFEWRQTPANTPAAQQDPIFLSSISANHDSAMTASLRNFVVWDTRSGQSRGYYRAPADMRSIAISNGGNTVLLGLADGRAIIVQLHTGRRLEFLGHRLHAQKEGIVGAWVGINSVAISPNGRYALSGGDDHFALLWDTKTGHVLYQWAQNGQVNLVALSNDGRFAFTASSHAQAFIWDLSNGHQISQLKLKSREYVLSAVRFSADGKTLLTGAPGRDLRQWRVRDGALLKQWKVSRRFQNRASGAVVLAVAYDPEGHPLSESSSGFGERWP